MRLTLVVTGLAVLATLEAGSLRVAAASGSGVAVVVQLHDTHGVPADVLRDARTDVERTFSTAGIRILWAGADTLAAAPDPPSSCARRLRVVIASGPEIDVRDSEKRIAGVLGKARWREGRAEVFYQRLEAAASRHPVALSLVLGHVLAHELGHLLLMTRDHSDAGIMREAVDFKHVAFRRFTGEQSRSIHTALLRSNKEIPPCHS